MSAYDRVFTSLLKLEMLCEQKIRLQREMAMAMVRKRLEDENMDGTVTPADYVPLRAAYEKAVAAGHKVFKYQDQDVVVSFAYYLLEYLHPHAEAMDYLGRYRYKARALRPAHEPLDKRSDSVQ